MKLQKEKILKIIKWISVLGMIVALYSLYEYYLGTTDSLCNINSQLNCYAVYQSKYSAIFGIPVALIGAVVYGFIFITSLLEVSDKTRIFENIIFGISLLAMIFSGYLIYVSAFIIKVWCPVCMISYGVIAAMFISTIFLKMTNKATINN